ncbi:VOC family protein [Micromonospora haikouensis]|uniref:VOC family protein n=1 Tax=Micromonospora haikouensis TaxID=686309 RepID=UPI0034170FD8
MPITGVDHVMLAVPDLDAARAAFTACFDRPSRPGSRHPGWGTTNAVLRFADSYLELITVVDRAEAAGRPASRRMTGVSDAGGGWVSAVLAAEDLPATCAALADRGVPVSPPLDGVSVRPDGRRRRWRVGAHGEEFRTGRLPSLIEYLDPWPEADPDPAELRRGGVHGVAGVDIAVTDLPAAAAEYAVLLGGPPALGDRSATWTLPDGRVLRLLAPAGSATPAGSVGPVCAGDPVAAHLDRLGPGLCAVALAVDSPAAVAAAVAGRGGAVRPGVDREPVVDPAGCAPIRLVAARPAPSRGPVVTAGATR